jgi:hypothetical protein
MGNEYFVSIQISIINGIVTPGDITEAAKKIPPEYVTKDKNPKVENIKTKSATVIFKCLHKTKSKIGKIILGKRESRHDG